MQIDLPIICERTRGSVARCRLIHIRLAEIAIVLHLECSVRIQVKGVHGRDSIVHEFEGGVLSNDHFLAAVRDLDGHMCLFLCNEANETKAHAIYTHIAATREVVPFGCVLVHSGNLHNKLKSISLGQQARQLERSRPTYRCLWIVFKSFDFDVTEINSLSLVVVKHRRKT